MRKSRSYLETGAYLRKGRVQKMNTRDWQVLDQGRGSEAWLVGAQLKSLEL